ncbi:glycosyltransferase family 4 protein [Pseudobutyrivibrio xylanivorans]|uniref:Glycosyltransferase involved in cell wall bisynthesis n=1 Tax=Pseudobutyrivibrio xylanivorans DSM 14809 TaxID=1123012 RepID=A0A1M6JEG8_PSEXY|nr:glycosyltransferase family 4 protein [Pseudobutyrivibrio xylanivorans]SHJ45136.1 Glycosyltransferase involved in cell wall bisynthesis [Pseudobutyrivibrio xylanivorans DSM 14809]
MNILFLSLLDFNSLDERGIYTDLLRYIEYAGHTVFAISPVEKRNGGETRLIREETSCILKLKIGNIQKTNVVEKGITTVTLERRFVNAIKKYFGDVKFDLLLYPTPPITFCGAVEYVKKRDGAKSYLMLKDIFPQNSVDLGMLSTGGLKGLIYQYFCAKERKLYEISDRIGCMSQANVDYVLEHNSWLDAEKVTMCPNALEVIDKSVDSNTRTAIRNKYGVPLDKKVFVYGGNLGRPQDIKHLVACIDSQKEKDDVFFLVVGDGTDYDVMADYVTTASHDKVRLMQRLPREDYDTLVGACDVGLIFLDHRFTIPNFPSRLLSYMQAKLPVLAVTDANTDIGRIIEDGNFGWWCESDFVDKFVTVMEQVMHADLSIGQNGFEYMKEHYNAEKVAKQVLAEVERIRYK